MGSMMDTFMRPALLKKTALPGTASNLAIYVAVNGAAVALIGPAVLRRLGETGTGMILFTTTFFASQPAFQRQIGELSTQLQQVLWQPFARTPEV